MGNLNMTKKMAESMTEINGLMLSINLLENEAEKKSLDFIKSALKCNDNRIDFHAYDEEGCRIDDNSFVVPYDGGAHPEYASNCFSDVNSIYIKDNNIFLDIEDCEEYPIDSIDDRTFCELCQYIFDNLI